MMLFRQRTLIIASLALLALSANTGVMVSADEAVDKDDKEDKEEDMESIEDEEEFEDFTGNVLDGVLDTIDEKKKKDELELPSSEDLSEDLSEDGNSTDIEFPEFMESQDNLTAVVIDMECACEGDIISCSNPADEDACVCEDGETVCVDVVADAVETMEPPATVDAGVTVEVDITETSEDTESEMGESGLMSGAYTASSVVSMAISAAGIAAVALN